MQYGHIKQERSVGAYSGSNTGECTYPTTFSNGYYTIVASVRNNAQVIASVEIITRSTYRILYHSHSGASQYVYGVTWLAYGN